MKKILIILVVLIILAIAGYFLLKKKPEVLPAPLTDATPQADTPVASPASTTIVTQNSSGIIEPPVVDVDKLVAGYAQAQIDQNAYLKDAYLAEIKAEDSRYNQALSSLSGSVLTKKPRAAALLAEHNSRIASIRSKYNMSSFEGGAVKIIQH